MPVVVCMLRKELPQVPFLLKSATPSLMLTFVYPTFLTDSSRHRFITGSAPRYSFRSFFSSTKISTFSKKLSLIAFNNQLEERNNCNYANLTQSLLNNRL